jgi:hypothetical protein
MAGPRSLAHRPAGSAAMAGCDWLESATVVRAIQVTYRTREGGSFLGNKLLARTLYYCIGMATRLVAPYSVHALA